MQQTTAAVKHSENVLSHSEDRKLGRTRSPALQELSGRRRIFISPKASNYNTNMISKYRRVSRRANAHRAGHP